MMEGMNFQNILMVQQKWGLNGFKISCITIFQCVNDMELLKLYLHLSVDTLYYLPKLKKSMHYYVHMRKRVPHYIAVFLLSIISNRYISQFK